MAVIGFRNAVYPDFAHRPAEPPPGCIARPQGYRSHHAEAQIERTADVEGQAVPLYTMTGNRAPWPALADVRRLLNGFTCRMLEVGTGLDRLTMGDALLDIVSPIATAAAVNLALQAGRIEASRAEAILKAIGDLST